MGVCPHALDDDLLEVLHVLDETHAADDVLDAVELEGAGADVEVGLPDGGGHLLEGHVAGEERLTVDIDLVLANVAADGGDLAHPGDRLQRVAHGEVLHAAQLVEIPPANDVALLVAPFERVPVHLPQGSGVRTEGGGGVFRQRVLRQRSQLFQDARAGPVELHVVFEDHVDRGEAEHAEAAHGAHSGNAEERGREWVADLVLDVARRAPRPLGEHNLLVFTDVRDRVDSNRLARQRPHVPAER